MIAEFTITFFSILNYGNQQKPSKKNHDEGGLFDFMGKKTSVFPYVIILNPEAFEIERGLLAYTGLGQLMDLLKTEFYEFLSFFPMTDFLSKKCLFLCWCSSETYNKKDFLEKLDEIFEDFDHENYQMLNGNESARDMADFLRNHIEKIKFISKFTEVGESCEEFLKKSKSKIWRVGKDTDP